MENTAIPLELRKERNETSSRQPPQLPPGDSSDSSLLYNLEDVPPWHLCLLFGFQQYLVFVGGTVGTALLMASLMCIEETDLERGNIVSSIIFVSGLNTLLQATFGIRLPIIQGASFAYVIPSITILSSFPSCESLSLSNLTAEERQENWQIKMRHLQGAIALSSVFQVIVGVTGAVGLLMSWITPLTIVPTITVLGLSLISVGTQQAATHWGISAMTLVLLVAVTQFLNNVKMPLPAYTPSRGFHLQWALVFTYFPVMIVMCISWAVCGVLTALDVLPEGSLARTDVFGSLIQDSYWFQVPYPGQWGLPTLSVAAVVGMISPLIASIIESIGDYHTCASLCRVPSPPTHAINRAVGCEGLGAVLAGLFGTSSGTASYTTNIVLIGITKVGSRRVVQVSGLLMLVTGMFSKCGAVFATIPEPVLGSSLMFMFTYITGVGLANLKLIDLQSSRNLFVLGFSVFMGLAVPEWLSKNPEAARTGSTVLDQSLMSLLQAPMFVGGMLGLILDNTIPGTKKERGLLEWSYYRQDTSPSQASTDAATHCYDLPFGMKTLSRWSWPRYVPVFPMYVGLRNRKVAAEPDTVVPAP